MKITFILPCVGRRQRGTYPRSWQMEPLAVAQLSALTPPDWGRSFYDDRIEAIPYDEATDVVAINVETYTARRAYQIATEFSMRGVTVIMGGFHATLVPDEVAEHADAVIVGEAETVWGEVLHDVSAGQLKSRYESGKRPDLAGLMPNWSMYDGKSYVKLGLVETGRGCRYACEFCSISSFFKQTYRGRPVEEVLEEIRRRGVKNVFFVDDNIAVDPERTRQLLEGLIPLNIRWAGQVSLDVSRDEGLLKLLHRSGCMGALIGFESLSPKSLEQMGKGVNRNAQFYDESIATFRKHGLSIYATFVFGYDGDTEQSFRDTLDFALRHKFFFTAFNHVVPFPGTALYDRLEQEGRLLHDKWWLEPTYRFGDVAFEPRHMSAERLAALCHEYRGRFYSLPSIFRRALDPRANCRNLFMTSLFIGQNLGSRFEVDQRQGLPLGREVDLCT